MSHYQKFQVVLKKTFPIFWGFAGTKGQRVYGAIQMIFLHHFQKSDGEN